MTDNSKSNNLSQTLSSCENSRTKSVYSTSVKPIEVFKSSQIECRTDFNTSKSSADSPFSNSKTVNNFKSKSDNNNKITAIIEPSNNSNTSHNLSIDKMESMSITDGSDELIRMKMTRYLEKNSPNSSKHLYFDSGDYNISLAVDSSSPDKLSNEIRKLPPLIPVYKAKSNNYSNNSIVNSNPSFFLDQHTDFSTNSDCDELSEDSVSSDI